MNERVRSLEINSLFKQFPYVNGGLFARHSVVPHLSQKARRIIVECGELNWADINPDIFGSMIQAVVNPDERANQGMHYTSVPNIRKVIDPLFLDELHEQYNAIAKDVRKIKERRDLGEISQNKYYELCKPMMKKCDDLLLRMKKMKFLDPACGSGNFLIITYKALRLLEMDILRLKQQCTATQTLDFLDGSVITINQFYGIELLDFPHEVAMLSLWLAEHQMNRKFHKEFGVNTRALPLKTITQIRCANACRVDWNEVCPHTKDEEVFVFGNPPYLGSKLQSKEQKQDIDITFGNLKNAKVLDYISIWFYKAALYIKGGQAKFAFVTTNSITQGEQVGTLWPEILNCGIEIEFAYTSFKWSNNAKYNAGVTVAIIGLRNKSIAPKYLFNGTTKNICEEINPYLTKGKQVIVSKSTKTPDGLPKICFGCMPYDKGHLLFDEYEYNNFVQEYPNDSIYLKRIYGSEEFINDKPRYCLWIDDKDYHLALNNKEIARRVELTRQMRLESPDVSGRKLAQIPYQFREHPNIYSSKIIIPAVSSENREYIPMGLLEAGIVVSNLAFAIYDAEPWLFGILTSKMHMAWVRTVGGKLKTDYRYSAQLCYNTFPFPKISEAKKAEIEEAAEDVLLARAGHPEKTLAEMYDPEKMPEDLREAHSKLDDVVDSCYAGYPFSSDEARLETLFKLYEKMTKKPRQTK